MWQVETQPHNKDSFDKENKPFFNAEHLGSVNSKEDKSIQNKMPREAREPDELRVLVDVT